MPLCGLFIDTQTNPLHGATAILVRPAFLFASPLRMMYTVWLSIRRVTALEGTFVRRRPCLNFHPPDIAPLLLLQL
jgi:hypothetical protein